MIINHLTFGLSLFLFCLVVYTSHTCGQTPYPPKHYDESRVPAYRLPDPLVFEDGTAVDTPEKWTDRRRAEVLALFEEHIYGQTPFGRPAAFQWTTLSEEDALDGKARRKIVRLTLFAEPDTHEIDLLMYFPKSATADKPVPVAVCLNFQGNHTISDDPQVPLGTIWVEKQDGTRRYRVPETAREDQRGTQSRRWPLELIVERGFAVVTAYYCQIEPDFNGGIKFGVRRNMPTPKSHQWGSIGAWAWGLSRIMDYIEDEGAEKRLDSKKVMLLGHSRLGKTALWAAAQDERFAVVVSNNSGCGGAALSRRNFGETVHLLNTVRPEWFADNYKRYNTCIEACPVDQHELIALIAPRPVYVASASRDVSADPRGEFLSAYHADSVYRLLGTDGIAGVSILPEPDVSVGGRIHYHLRTGEHDILAYDWEQFLNFFLVK